MGYHCPSATQEPQFMFRLFALVQFFMRRTVSLLVGLAACAVLAGPGVAQDRAMTSTWDHNGSTMVMEKYRRNVEIRYEQPSRRIRRLGVRSGDVLFTGRLNRRGRLAGEAFVFRRNCQPAGYDVRGRFDPDRGQDELILRGAAPIRERGGCDVVDYSRDRKSARLLFTLVGQDGHSGRKYDSEGQDEPEYQDGHAGRDTDYEGQEDAANDRVTEPPSFNCRPYVKSGKCPEAMICASGQLASQDAMMGRLYKEVLSLSRSPSERQSYKNEQRSSLKDRNSCGCDLECLEQWYYNMNKSLGKTTVILGR